MNKDDFKKDMRVYLFVIEGSNEYHYLKNRPFEDRIWPATVISVGNKYITVRPDKWSFGEVRFRINERFRQEYKAGGEDYELFLTEQDIYDCEEAEVIYRTMRNGFSQWKNDRKYSLDQLRRIKAIIEETNND